MEKLKQLTAELADIIEILRSDHGCPWDRQQTIASLSEYIIEEVYEAYDAMEKNDHENLKEELGDILSQVFMISQIAKEKNYFSLEDVYHGIVDKLLRRHPHVFGDKKASSEKEALDLWNEEKMKEKKERKTLFDGIPGSLPTIMYALKVINKTTLLSNFKNKVDIREISIKIKQILDFLCTCKENDINQNKGNDEAGDLLFLLILLMNYSGINPDFALRGSIEKFIEFSLTNKENDPIDYFKINGGE